ncbi:MAG: CARDB domain-containing protein, partial [Anaerolineae bacterium]
MIIHSITIAPPVPDVGESCTITVVVKNQGNARASGFRTYLYVNPADRPPTPTTPDTSWIYRFGLNPGESFAWTYSFTFTSLSCDHVIYAWVDRDNDVLEDDETNNLSSVQVCVGATPTPTPSPTATPTPTPTPCLPDNYEPDDVCNTAREISTDGTHQIHNLCPVGDEDWVKITARAGITYTIETTAVEQDGDTVLTLYSACGGPPVASDDPASGTVARIVWTCANSGVYYVKVNHHSTDYGQATGYELSVTASTSCPGDVYEKDDSCSAARDIPTDGTAQTHLFCVAGDHDWVKFRATSGAT